MNLRAIVTGDWRDPYTKGHAILMEGGKITSVGTAPTSMKAYAVDIDADGATITHRPRLIARVARIGGSKGGAQRG